MEPTLHPPSNDHDVGYLWSYEYIPFYWYKLPFATLPFFSSGQFLPFLLFISYTQSLYSRPGFSYIGQTLLHATAPMPKSLCYLASLLLLAAGISPAAASPDDINPSLEDWRAANERAKALRTCPLSCQDNGGSDIGSELPWSLFSDMSSVAKCNETMLLSVNIQTSGAEDEQLPIAGIRACKADYGTKSAQKRAEESETPAICPTPNNDIVEVSVMVGKPAGHVTGSGASPASPDDILSAGRQVQSYLGTKAPSCTENVLTFGYARSAAVGLFAGAEVYQHGVHAGILSRFLDDVERGRLSSEAKIVQICAENGRGADYAIGIVAAPAKDFTLVQEAVRTWAEGGCVKGDVENYMTVRLRVPSQAKGSNTTESVTSYQNSTEMTHAWSRSRLVARGTCRSIAAGKGEGCWALAKRCGISQPDLTKYNPSKNFCNKIDLGQRICCSAGTLPDLIPPSSSDGTCRTIRVVHKDLCKSLAAKCGLPEAEFIKLNSKDEKFCNKLKIGQPVCCTRGKLPDITPKPGKDGSCAVYTVKKEDGCDAIATAHGLTVEKIEEYNKKTWGWNGCDPKLLYVDTKICISKGTPPFPQPVRNAVCGPQVAGTKKPSSGSSDDWVKLNPCPLSVCCNIWGQCGTTDDFCRVSKSKTGAPGTSEPGKNGCISNCGREIVKGSPVTKPMRVAYFEAWNVNRKCLRMDVDQIDTNKYTHIHFSFADITPSYGIDVSSSQNQFRRFKEMSGVKKIISFGGWDFSTKPGTFRILREAVKGPNRATFVRNIVSFLKEHNLDGVDIDWEYPGAPDIPDIPAGEPDAGKDYYETLSSLKAAVGNGKSVSLAAPASYWYLKAFPIKEMAAKLDYIIYMTYDLHGQWDYGNKWTSPGCPTGNCLRSHVNLTETMDALSMITKAGMPANKVVVGVSSYGRSFKMAQAGCTGPDCLFTGSARVSNAAKGRCTDTGGYISNAEIQEIIRQGRATKQWLDGSGSNILVYDKTEWVSYMDAATKKFREDVFAAYNFAGTSDWAVDLQEFVDSDGDDDYDPNYVASVDRNAFPPCDAKSSSTEATTTDSGFMRNTPSSRYPRRSTPSWATGMLGTSSSARRRGTAPAARAATFPLACWTATSRKTARTAPARKRRRVPPSSKTGRTKEWIKFGDIDVQVSNGCQFAGEGVRDCQKKQDDWFWNYPLAADDIKLLNPKDVIVKSYENSKDLLTRLKVIRAIGSLDPLLNMADVADASSLPALTMASAVDSMEKVIKAADDIKKKEREEMISHFIGGILFFIPFVGEVVGPSMAAVRTALAMIEVAGEAGLLAYSIVQDPKHAYMAVFSTLAGAGLSRGSWSKAAAERRSLRDEDVMKLGSIRADLGKINDIRGGFCRL
ncbi:glycosyl hydrolase, family 18 [Drechmeria coniospora]|uniref:chitinase n=1 Tax=Drechmeria coniospora TaxID=98403 RepID=A0A151GV05_DRECN|nr:glycosyl hydrolase, family 18 [Drechmeria coniospora]KYK60893.1 glycosyl hydrolase, family 18 [Drechmeria coniospora]